MVSPTPTVANTAVVFLDLQTEIAKNSQTVEVAMLERTAGALAKLAALHTLPFVLSAVPGRGEYFASILEPLGNPVPRDRTFTTAFADQGLVAELNESGREVLILAGIASEIVVQRTALDALAAGYSVYVAVDACGGISERTEQAAWRRIAQAGGTTTSVITFAAELAGDYSQELGQKTMGIFREMMGR